MTDDLKAKFSKAVNAAEIPAQDEGEDIDASRCFARARLGRQSVPMLGFRKIDGTRRSFVYHGIGPLDFLSPGHIELTATTPDGRVWLVTIKGRNLLTIHDSIFEGKCIWVQEVRDMEASRAPASATVVESLVWVETEAD